MSATATPTAVLDLGSLSLVDAVDVGGKAANLGELIAAGIPVPPGFVVSADAFGRSMRAGAVDDELAELHSQALSATGDDATVERLCRQMRAVVDRAGIEKAVEADVRRAYDHLVVASAERMVAVRSSAVGEDAASASFAGMNATYTSIGDADTLVRAVRWCWASLFTPRVVTYRSAAGISATPSMAVVVQTMVSSRSAGVAFTADPVTGADDVVVVEAAQGLGEVVVSGSVEPDTYRVDKATAAVRAITIGDQSIAIMRGDDGVERQVDLPPDERVRRVIGDAEVHTIVELARRIEAHHGRPQDVEWAIDGRGTVWIVQARPITTRGGPPSAVVVRGLAASPGTATGRVRVLRRPGDGSRLLDGEVLVAPRTDPDWLPTIRRAAAVVTDSGGSTCHAAIVAREVGIPCVVGTHSATERLTTGQVVSVDGGVGEVRSGRPPASASAAATPVSQTSVSWGAPTATRVYVNLASSHDVDAVARRPVDGVGLLRAEMMMVDALHGRHPAAVLAAGDTEQFVSAMADGISTIAAAFEPRPVIYRASDFRTNEFRSLEGGSDVEPLERNPMIGFRGCLRYVHDPELFRAELSALARVRERHPSVHLMIPFVRTGSELDRCLTIVDESDVGADRGLLRWIMAEVPSVVHWLPEYVGAGIDGVSIGSNDLTQLILGVDRDSETCADAFDETDPAVLEAIERIVTCARSKGITSSLCGEAVSRHPGYPELLVRMGITSVSVNPDVADRVRAEIASAERRILLDAARTSG